MENHRESRKRLRPWLERMINSGECPGLVWENRDDRTFRIPWRHFNNKEWVEEDSKIFREWAKYTGKYQDGDKVEYPVWKTRLRCALKKIPEIEEIPEKHHLEDADPYRVYKFVDVWSQRLTKRSSFKSSPPVFSQTSKLANVPRIVFDEEIVYTMSPVKKESSDIVLRCEDSENLSTLPKIELYADEISGQQGGNCHFAGVNLTDNVSQSSESITSLPSDLKSVNTDELCLLESLELPISMESSPNPSLGSYAQNMGDMSVGEPLMISPSIPIMHMAVYYGSPSVPVIAVTIQGPGIRFFAPNNISPVNLTNSLEETLFGPKEVYQMALPGPDQYLTGTSGSFQQNCLITKLLENMERGVVLTNDDSDIYVRRLCKTRVFLTDGLSESTLIGRKGDSLTKAFDYKKFCKEYEEFRHGLKKDLPKPFFILTLGQEIRKSHFHPMSNILIYVVVRHDLATKIISQDPNVSHSSPNALYSFDSYDKLLEDVKKVVF
ncbi:interferon regulatory factor 8-like [Biomphalaria glabrata]|uniref:Interferon regulatory factor 8-like n=1 Tax=Biomphalaria glabrata TaxID=6526 RepID=A0A9W3BGH9_BIOGL|nr:interferon regulatory factor 8-like [Biomphalaria glabrata]KAI8750664.1 interferon regulatory factor 8 [Biomphalaria glabrata]